MKINAKYGFSSIIFGTIAIVLAFVVTHAYSIYYADNYSWFIFNWLDNIGFIKNNSEAPAISEASVFSISEANAILWAKFLAIGSIISAIVLVIAAELKRENTLFFSVGFALASLAMVLINLKVGLTLVFFVFVALMFIRNRKTRYSK